MQLVEYINKMYFGQKARSIQAFISHKNSVWQKKTSGIYALFAQNEYTMYLIKEMLCIWNCVISYHDNDNKQYCLLFNAQRLILKLEDVILAKVWAPSEAADKKKSGKMSHRDCPEMLHVPGNFVFKSFFTVKLMC